MIKFDDIRLLETSLIPSFCDSDDVFAKFVQNITNLALYCKICLKLYKSCSKFVLYGIKRKIHQKNPSIL